VHWGYGVIQETNNVSVAGRDPASKRPATPDRTQRIGTSRVTEASTTAAPYISLVPSIPVSTGNLSPTGGPTARGSG
jgi:hypothetical protein